MFWSRAHSLYRVLIGSASENYVPTSAARDDGLQEHSLVDELTAPGGIRAAPPRENIVDFVRR